MTHVNGHLRGAAKKVGAKPSGLEYIRQHGEAPFLGRMSAKYVGVIPAKDQDSGSCQLMAFINDEVDCIGTEVSCISHDGEVQIWDSHLFGACCGEVLQLSDPIKRLNKLDKEWMAFDRYKYVDNLQEPGDSKWEIESYQRAYDQGIERAELELGRLLEKRNGVQKAAKSHAKRINVDDLTEPCQDMYWTFFEKIEAAEPAELPELPELPALPD